MTFLSTLPLRPLSSPSSPPSPSAPASISLLLPHHLLPFARCPAIPSLLDSLCHAEQAPSTPSSRPIFDLHFNSLVEKPNPAAAITLYEQLKWLDFIPNDYTYTKALCRTHELDGAARLLFHHMVEIGSPPIPLLTITTSRRVMRFSSIGGLLGSP